MKAPLGLFAGVGIEIEYMIVDRRSLDVRPLADQVLHRLGGGYELEVVLGPIAWSNELALHVIELKTNGPAPDLRDLGPLFHQHALRVDALLQSMDARLMPSAMHPWMDPDRELRLWPHENNPIYSAFDRIFDCRGHGWANLQSMHINLPFADDREFARLHAAIRFVLPLLPALAASSPIVGGVPQSTLDSRLAFYRDNARRVPSVTGAVVPEAVYSRSQYESEILGRIYADLAPLDPDGVLRHEWVNGRGCIARFDRNTIEIRVIDTQEWPGADLAVAGATIAAVRWLSDRTPCANWPDEHLVSLLTAAIADGDQAVVADAGYLEVLGFPGRAPAPIRDVWQFVFENLARVERGHEEWQDFFATYLRHGCLARRILADCGADPDADRLLQVYAKLCDCLREGRLFVPADG